MAEHADSEVPRIREIWKRAYVRVGSPECVSSAWPPGGGDYDTAMRESGYGELLEFPWDS